MATRRVTERDILEYADLSHDHNPLHVDPVYSARGPFGGVVAHGFLALGPVLADLSGQDPPLELRVRFRRPLRPEHSARSDWNEPAGSFKVLDGEEILLEGTVVFADRASGSIRTTAR